MPYYRTIDHKFVPSFDGTSYWNQPVDLYSELIGWRSSAPKRGKSTRLAGPSVEPYSWLDANNSIKAKTFKSSHPDLAHLFKKDKGHAWDLTTVKFSPDLFSCIVRTSSTAIVRENVRLAVPSIVGYVDPLTLPGTALQLSNYAALEYGSASPSSDQFSVSAFVGELREGLPRLIPMLLSTGQKRAFKETLEKQTRRAKDAGSDYLNVQFGWIPLLSDVRKIATALAVATSATSSSELTTHRRRDKPGTDTTISGVSTSFSGGHSWNTNTLGDNYTGRGASFVGVQGDFWGSQRFVQDYSFEAEFLRLPRNSYDADPYLKKFNELMRMDITPQDLWQLAPWSWLVDWFFDLGAQLDSWQAATTNQILSLYAYGMRDERRITTTIVSNIRKGPNPVHVSYTGPSGYYSQMEIRRRQRIKANPFGYTLNPLTQLSAGQLAILGALGLTRSKR